MIRVATAADIPGMQRVRSIVRENVLADQTTIGPDEYRAYLQEPARTWVSIKDSRVVGFAAANAQRGHIWALFVDPDWEGRGIGRALHDTMLAWLAAEGVLTATLSTGPKTRASRFYEANDWVLRGVEPNGDSIYRKSLKARCHPW